MSVIKREKICGYEETYVNLKKCMILRWLSVCTGCPSGVEFWVNIINVFLLHIIQQAILYFEPFYLNVWCIYNFYKLTFFDVINDALNLSENKMH